MKQLEISKLIDLCLDFFKANNYTLSRIYAYKALWRKGIIPFLKSKDTDIYCEELGKEFCKICVIEGRGGTHEREKIRSIHVLDDMLNLGYIRKRSIIPVRHPLDGAIGLAMNNYISHLQALRRANSTLRLVRLNMSRFLDYLHAQFVENVSEITENHISGYLACVSKGRKSEVLSSVRGLFRYWKECHEAEGHFEEFFSTLKIKPKKPVPSFYCPEEVLKIENSVSRSSSVGKRNYAMLLLASRLGLRASDIASLSFENIDWEKCIIKLSMQKTGKEIELPLLPAVGNAIIDYLRNGRPNSELTKIFLAARAPYIAVNNKAVGNALNSIIRQSGVDTSQRHHGPHSMRHSLATALMGENSPLPVISEVLGHRSTETTMVYLKIDVESLKKCAMPVPPVKDGFYNQRGGAFYG